MNSSRNSTYVLAGATIAASLAGLLTAFVMPFALAPIEYVKISLGFALSQLVSNVSTEWIRVGVIRYGDEYSETSNPLHVELVSLYAIVVSCLLVCGISLSILSIRYPSLAMAGAIGIAAALQSMHDGRAAWARARFDNDRLSIATVARPIAMLVLSGGLAWMTGRAVWGMAGLALSFLVATIILGARLPRARTLTQLSLTKVSQLVRFGAWPAIGTNISLSVPVALRTLLAATLSATSAGGALFALELGQRAFSITGQALNMLSLQTLIRTSDTATFAEMANRVRSVVELNSYIFIFCFCVSATTSSEIAATFSPRIYADSFVTYAPTIFAFLAITSLRQYTIDPLFLVTKHTFLMVIPPGALIFSLAIVIFSKNAFSLQISAILPLLILAAASSLLVSLWLNQRVAKGTMPWKRLSVAVSAGLLAYFAASKVVIDQQIISALVKFLICGMLLAIPYIFWNKHREAFIHSHKNRFP